MPIRVAIVGAGPAGFYTAEALLRLSPDAEVDLIDRLPTPFGLARYGVAPDHQGTKAIVRVFDRVAQKPGVQFLGNLAIGRDVTVDELRGLYDAVVLSTGAAEDRRLGIPGEALGNVFGSGAFVHWYNAHPDHAALAPDLAVKSVAVIGHGNVAIDVARVLAKTAGEMAKSDLSPLAAPAIHAAPVTHIHLIGRGGPMDARFTNAELAELGRLERAVPVVQATDVAQHSPAGDRVKQANLATLQQFASLDPEGKPVRLHFHFNARPVAFHGDGRVTGLRLQTIAGDKDLPCELAVTCVGYRSTALAGVPFDSESGIIANDRGLVAPGLYVVGWAARGPSGVIAANRADGVSLATRLIAEVDAGDRPGAAGLAALLARRGIWTTTYEDWRRIDVVETTAGEATGAPRRKLADWAALREALGR